MYQCTGVPDCSLIYFIIFYLSIKIYRIPTHTHRYAHARTHTHTQPHIFISDLDLLSLISKIIIIIDSD